MPLFERVRQYLQRHPLATDASGEPAHLELQVATVVLLLETAYGNDNFAASERREILHGIEREFGLSEVDALRLIEEAERSRVPGVDVPDLVERISERYDLEQRKRIAGLVWTVVYADRDVDPAEERVASRIMELTGLNPEEALDAREKAFVWFSGTWRNRS